MEAVEECFVLVSSTETTAEIADSVVVAQRQGVQKFLQFLKTVTDFSRIALVGFSIGLVELIQDGFAIAIAKNERMGL